MHIFNLKTNNYLVAFLLIFILSSCSSLSSLKFWESEDIDPDEPKTLNPITNSIDANVDWKKSFSGNNLLGSFEPAFSSKSIFFADADGNIESIDPSSGNPQWEQKVDELSSGVAAGFGIIVVSDVKGNVITLSQDSGSILWSVNVKGEVLAPPAIDAKFIIVKTGSGELLALIIRCVHNTSLYNWA